MLYINIQAGTGCGGCEPMVKDIFAFAMKSTGKEISTDVCEHFAYTRQQLYDIIRVSAATGGQAGGGEGTVRRFIPPFLSTLIGSYFVDSYNPNPIPNLISVLAAANYGRWLILSFYNPKAGGIKSFEELLDSHGHGDGCEICKPLVASILASVNNDMIFDNNGMALQDTNDRSLANMQRGMTLSSRVSILYQAVFL